MGDRIIHFPLNTLIRVSQTAAHEYEIKGRMCFQFQKGVEVWRGRRNSSALQSCGAMYLAVTPSPLPLECKYGLPRLWSCEGKDDFSIMLSQHSGLGRAVAPLRPGPNPPIVFFPSLHQQAAHSHLQKWLRACAFFFFPLRTSSEFPYCSSGSITHLSSADSPPPPPPPPPPTTRCCYRLSIFTPSINQMKPSGCCGCEGLQQEVSVRAPPGGWRRVSGSACCTHTLLCTKRT